MSFFAAVVPRAARLFASVRLGLGLAYEFGESWVAPRGLYCARSQDWLCGHERRCDPFGEGGGGAEQTRRRARVVVVAMCGLATGAKFGGAAELAQAVRGGIISHIGPESATDICQ